uniref:Uncharacterized protein n=1 Tax=Anguilla anguilla TaxID=7936 RepID=A0A0E9W7D5_ANGAN
MTRSAQTQTHDRPMTHPEKTQTHGRPMTHSAQTQTHNRPMTCLWAWELLPFSHIVTCIPLWKRSFSNLHSTQNKDNFAFVLVYKTALLPVYIFIIYK